MVTFRNNRTLKRAILATALAVLAPWSARAVYYAPGYDLQVVSSAQGLVNGAVNYQTNGLWGTSAVSTPLTTHFTLSACDTVAFSRLYLDLWGGTSAKTCTVTATLNGTALAAVTCSGIADTNPGFDASKTCVYGTGSGMWQVAYAGIASLLKTDGTANTLSFSLSSTNGFDGRTASASLVTVYTDTDLKQTLDYYLAEGDGTLRKTPGTNGSPATRSLAFNGLDTINIGNATYYAGYTHGTTGEKDQVYFNGTTLGGSDNDVALGTTSDYGPSNHAFDVTSLLTTTSTAYYSVTAADVGVSGEGYLRANIGLLEITHPIPEPAALALLLAGAVTLLRRRPGKI